MKDYHQIYEFIKKWSKSERFENSPMKRDFPDYTEIITKSTIASFKRKGFDCIDCHSSVTGESIFFDSNLNILTDEQTETLFRKTLDF